MRYDRKPSWIQTELWSHDRRGNWSHLSNDAVERSKGQYRLRAMLGLMDGEMREDGGGDNSSICCKQGTLVMPLPTPLHAGPFLPHLFGNDFISSLIPTLDLKRMIAIAALHFPPQSTSS
mmetsp:Transcript_24607/g.49846  ORF Transcript_24607/g.49846 Transcript_24607/m.49846 type:complete len:120 (-) Transcript_24607:71-430(-)